MFDASKQLCCEQKCRKVFERAAAGQGMKRKEMKPDDTKPKQMLPGMASGAAENLKDAQRDRLERQFAFFREIDREKFIERQTLLTDGRRRENDAEHAWHMAVMAILLGEYSNEEIDVLRTVSMILIHDVVEIDAGDTYAYDEAGKTTQRQREEAAADRLFAILPEDQGRALRELWEEFEARSTPEARFARVMDNLQPMMLNHASDGKAWTDHNIALSQVLKRNAKTAEGSEVLWDYAKEAFLRPNVEKGRLREDCSLTEEP